MRSSLRFQLIAVLIADAAATLVTVLPCPAQVSVRFTRVEFAPFVGAYQPHADVVNASLGCFHADPFPSVSCGGTVRQRTAAIVGGQITGWLGGQFAVDLSVGYSWSGMVSQPFQSSLSYPPQVGSDTSAHILTGSARLLVNLTPPAVRTSFYLVGGWAFVTHGGDGYAATVHTFGDAVRGSTDWGPVLGVGARAALTPTLAPRAELQYHLYTTGPGADVSRFRGDLVLSFGLSATLSGRGGVAR